MPYRDAWRRQEQAHERVLAGEGEVGFLVEHPPVITYGRRPGAMGNVLASAEQLAERGVEVVQSDRGGDVTFHGPGQIVAYPIVRLADHGLSISGYVHRLEQIVIAVLGDCGIAAHTDPGAIGVWTRDDHGELAKIAAIGVRIQRGVSMHGVALNVEVDLDYFRLIVPCGLLGRGVTSMKKIMGDRACSYAAAKLAVEKRILQGFAEGTQRHAAAEDGKRI